MRYGGQWVPRMGTTRARRADELVGAGAARLSSASDLAATLQGIAAAAHSALGAHRATCYVHDVEDR